MLGLTKSALREAMAKARAMLVLGHDDDECAEQLGFTRAEWDELKKALLEQEADRLRERLTEEVYAQYVLDQLACVKDLVSVQKTFGDSKQASAIVGAIRARSDIIDKIITRGQEFGFIEKRPERTEVTGGFLVAEMSNAELRSEIMRQVDGLKVMMEAHGKGGDLLDIEAGPVHRALPAPPRTAKAKSDKVHGGRPIFRKKT